MNKEFFEQLRENIPSCENEKIKKQLEAIFIHGYLAGCQAGYYSGYEDGNQSGYCQGYEDCELDNDIDEEDDFCADCIGCSKPKECKWCCKVCKNPCMDFRTGEPITTDD